MKITYEDKETKINNESIPIKNKVTAENMNEIKNTVNANDDEVKQIKAILPTTTGTGTNVTLTNTAEMEFVKSPIPMGNTTQDGTPSPDSEVEVETVTGDVEVIIQNKNIFDYNLFETFTNTIQYITIQLKPNTSYTMSSNIPATSGVGTNLFFMLDGESANTSTNGVRLNTPKTLTTNSGGVVKVGYRNAGGLENNPQTSYWYQIEENSTATSYEPHQEQILPLTLGNIELCKIGDYQDYIYKDNGKWYIHKEIEKYIFNGSENWTSWGAVSGSSNTMSQAGMAMTFINRAGVSNMFEVKADYSVTEHIVIAGGLTMLYVQINNSRLSTVDLDGFKNWLSSNNVTFYCIPATSTDTEITSTTLIEQLEAIEQATSYEEQTNISGTSTKVNPIFSLEAYQSIKLVLAG